MSSSNKKTLSEKQTVKKGSVIKVTEQGYRLWTQLQGANLKFGIVIAYDMEKEWVYVRFPGWDGGHEFFKKSKYFGKGYWNLYRNEWELADIKEYFIWKSVHGY